MKDETAGDFPAFEVSRRSASESENDSELRRIAEELIISHGPGWNRHMLATLKRQSLSRLLYLDSLYKKIVNVPGVILEFGVQYGASLVNLMNLRGVYEPYNFARRIVGFDTFEGFTSLSPEDGSTSNLGDYSTGLQYLETLSKLLEIQESFSPLGHIKKWELVRGDVEETAKEWFSANPEVIVAMAIFDMDVYRPTRHALEQVLPRLVKGSLLVFDELNSPDFPGETQAVQDVIGVSNLRLFQDPNQPLCSWAVFGD